jgi:hypothetical protein
MVNFIGEYFVKQVKVQKEKLQSKSEEDESIEFEEAVKNDKFAVSDLK